MPMQPRPMAETSSVPSVRVCMAPPYARATSHATRRTIASLDDLGATDLASVAVMTFSRDELEDAFRTYWRTGAVGENWDAWADLFTEDAEYVEHVLGDL